MGVRCKLFLGFTSNLMSSGVREQLRYLAQHSMVDVMVTTAGGIEEDFIKVWSGRAPLLSASVALPR